MKRLPPLAYMLLTVMVSVTGTSCKQLGGDPAIMAPVAFTGAPSLQDVIYTVNANTTRVQSLQSDSASLSGLRAHLEMEPPRRFRLRASFLGPELDVGSNDELFWVWAKRSDQPGVFFARHDQLNEPRARRILPVPPDWLLEAFGLVYLDPVQAAYHGPIPHNDGNYEIQSPYGVHGELIRRLTIHAKYGWIIENRIENRNGQVLAIARTSQHRYYSDVGVSLPHRVEIDLPPAQLSFAIDTAQYSINQFMGDPQQLWAVPQIDGIPNINVVEMESIPPSLQGAPSLSVPNYTPTPRVGFHQPYRGYSSWDLPKATPRF